MATERVKILVLCTGNSCRSQIAEGYFRHLAGDRVDVKSAGLDPKGLSPKAIEVMKEVGVDISNHTSNHLKEFLNEEFDFVITVCDNAAKNCPIWPKKTERLHWPFPDPAIATGTETEILEVFRKVRDDIDMKVKQWLASENIIDDSSGPKL